MRAQPAGSRRRRRGAWRGCAAGPARPPHLRSPAFPLRRPERRARCLYPPGRGRRGEGELPWQWLPSPDASPLLPPADAARPPRHRSGAAPPQSAAPSGSGHRQREGLLGPERCSRRAPHGQIKQHL